MGTVKVNSFLPAAPVVRLASALILLLLPIRNLRPVDFMLW